MQMVSASPRANPTTLSRNYAEKVGETFFSCTGGGRPVSRARVLGHCWCLTLRMRMAWSTPGARRPCRAQPRCQQWRRNFASRAPRVHSSCTSHGSTPCVCSLSCFLRWCPPPSACASGHVPELRKLRPQSRLGPQTTSCPITTTTARRSWRRTWRKTWRRLLLPVATTRRPQWLHAVESRCLEQVNECPGFSRVENSES
mmetsp:Transcript_66985/g.107871  ORF Transcript_66985/g.107871 Transcript_66985/m.107871 type:complete len:200 (-) Transcript_66985:349-948(-)